jgi:polygalacturonase
MRASALLLCVLVQQQRQLCSGGGSSSASPPAPRSAGGPNNVLRGRYVSVEIAPVECVATNYGARGDGKTDDTKAIQAAFDHCGLAGGGTIVLPAPHTYLIYSVHFTASNQELRIEEGATLLGSDNIKAWEDGKVGSALIVAPKKLPSFPTGLQHIAITGGGTVDGQGLLFWRGRVKNVFRPHTVDFSHVEYGLISGPTFTRNPNHVLELGCDHCELSHIKVLNPPSTGSCEKDLTCSHNTDAVDVHGTPFYIHNVNFTTGDDNVAVHANDTLVEDSYMGTGHGVSIGSMCQESITNLTVRNVSFHGTTAACKVKAHPTDSKTKHTCAGHVWGVTYENLTMKDVQLPIDLEQFYDVKSSKLPSSKVFYERITYRNIHSVGGGDKHGKVVSFTCDNHYDGENNCASLAFENVVFTGLGSASKKAGMLCEHAKGSATGLVGINNCLGSK